MLVKMNQRETKTVIRHRYAFATHIPVAKLSIIFSFHLFKVIALSWSLKPPLPPQAQLKITGRGYQGMLHCHPISWKSIQFFGGNKMAGTFDIDGIHIWKPLAITHSVIEALCYEWEPIWLHSPTILTFRPPSKTTVPTPFKIWSPSGFMEL